MWRQGVVCGHEQLTLYEMRKVQQEDASVRAKMGGKGIQHQNAKIGKSAFGRARHGEKSGPEWTALIWCKVFGLCAATYGTKTDELIKKDTREDRKMFQRICILEEGKCPDRSAREWKVEGT